MTVYLIHFNQKITNHAQHYIGYTADLTRRMNEHFAGKRTAGRLVQVAKHRRIGFVLARVWDDGDREMERRLKSRHNAAKLCPICRGEFTYKPGETTS